MGNKGFRHGLVAMCLAAGLGACGSSEPASGGDTTGTPTGTPTAVGPTDSLDVKSLRDYFITRGGKSKFYDDHVQRYKKRPIYWLFSSPKGSFNALIYMHRYTPSTVSTVLNEYLREFTAKLTSSLQQQDRLAAGDGTPRQQAAAQKEADRLRKVLLELEEYEHDVLYPLASRQLAMDLDDGVKANYPKFGAALKKIPGLEASDE